MIAEMLSHELPGLLAQSRRSKLVWKKTLCVKIKEERNLDCSEQEKMMRK
jgi:hypothetical protein